MHPLALIWFLLITAMIAAYAVFDGFDLGAGFWSLFAKNEGERRRILAAVGPFWDGNEVWLLTGGGAIFAAFPEAYATVFSGFYFAFILVILAFIFRAVSIEFFAKHDAPAWRRCWGAAFGIGSAVPPLIFGVAVGNLLRGVPLDAAKNYTGSFVDLLNPYALFAGAVVLALFAAHGAAWMALRSSGEEGERWARRLRKTGILSLLMLLAFFGASVLFAPAAVANFSDSPSLLIIPIFAVVEGAGAILFATSWNRHAAFASQAVAVGMSVATVATACFPCLVRAGNDPALSLTIMNAASSPLTHKAMLVIAAIGMPFVVLYHVWIYRAFSARTREAA